MEYLGLLKSQSPFGLLTDWNKIEVPASVEVAVFESQSPFGLLTDWNFTGSMLQCLKR